MSFGSKFFKQNHKQWYYYPFGAVLKEICMPVKEGQKDIFERTLNQEMLLAVGSTAVWVSLGFIKPYFAWLGLLLIPYLIYYRRSNEKRYCDYQPYKFSSFLKNYHRVCLYYIDRESAKKWWYGLFFIPFMVFCIYQAYEGKQWFLFVLEILLLPCFFMGWIFSVEKRVFYWKEDRKNKSVSE